MGFDGLPLIAQVSNVSSLATIDQMEKLFGFMGKIKDIRMYPSISVVQPQFKVCYIKYAESWSVRVALHLTNTVFIDRALVVVAIPGDTIPSEDSASFDLLNPTSALPGFSGFNDVSNDIAAVDGNLVITSTDTNLDILGLPQYPPLPADQDPNTIEEIRRTIYIENISQSVGASQLLDFINGVVGEVKYLRMAKHEKNMQSAFVEFSDRTSIVKALQCDGITMKGNKLKIAHSSTAIVKPPNDSQVISEKETEEALKKLKEAESLIARVVEPEITGKSSRHLRRSSSRSRRHSSRSRHRSRSNSRRHKRERRSISKSRRSNSISRRRRSTSRKRRSRSPFKRVLRSRSRSTGRRSRSRSIRHRKSRSISKSRRMKRERSGSRGRSSRSLIKKGHRSRSISPMKKNRRSRSRSHSKQGKISPSRSPPMKRSRSRSKSKKSKTYPSLSKSKDIKKSVKKTDKSGKSRSRSKSPKDGNLSVSKEDAAKKNTESVLETMAAPENKLQSSEDNSSTTNIIERQIEDSISHSSDLFHAANQEQQNLGNSQVTTGSEIKTIEKEKTRSPSVEKAKLIEKDGPKTRSRSRERKRSKTPKRNIRKRRSYSSSDSSLSPDRHKKKGSRHSSRSPRKSSRHSPKRSISPKYRPEKKFRSKRSMSHSPTTRSRSKSPRRSIAKETGSDKESM